MILLGTNPQAAVISSRRKKMSGCKEQLNLFLFCRKGGKRGGGGYEGGGFMRGGGGNCQGSISAAKGKLLWSAIRMQHASRLSARPSRQISRDCGSHGHASTRSQAATHLRAEYLSHCRGDSNESAVSLSHSTKLRLLRWKHVQQLH